ncbi:MAG: GNAT family N-acetyltransferase [Ginsengibacter sp.]
MNTSQFLIRKATVKDFEKVFDLYKSVSKKNGGLARNEDEITIDYVKSFVEKSFHNGVQFVIEDKLRDAKIIAEIHCYKLEPKVSGHILSDLTISVNPDYQGIGFGKKLFQTLLE